jgi:membrane associated rhomboid family serine protease
MDPPRLFPRATAVLIALNVGVWLLQVAAGVAPLHPPSAVLIAWGGDLPLLTLTGDTWRLVTALFLHGGLLHLAMNMAALAFTGTRVEDEFGTPRMVVIYLAGGVLANAASILWNERHAAAGDVAGLMTVSVGASGAIMALFGALLAALVLVPPRFAHLPAHGRPQVDSRLVQLVATNLALGFVVPHVDQAAHVGGLLAGLVLGGLMAARPGAAGGLGALARHGAAALLVTACVVALLRGAPHLQLQLLRAQWSWQQPGVR